jgi:hypothetical protein
MFSRDHMPFLILVTGQEDTGVLLHAITEAMSGLRKKQL